MLAVSVTTVGGLLQRRGELMVNFTVCEFHLSHFQECREPAPACQGLAHLPPGGAHDVRLHPDQTRNLSIPQYIFYFPRIYFLKYTFYFLL